MGPTYRTYTELLEPRRVAMGLMQIQQQLANEWRDDLTQHVAREGYYLADECDEYAEGCAVDAGPQPSMITGLGDLAAAAVDIKIELPPVLYASLRAASASWNSDLNEDGVTPFRAENLDLLQRAVTREAALSALLELEEEAKQSSTHAASALWLRERIEAYAPMWEEPPRNQLAGLFLIELLTAGPVAKSIAPDTTRGIEAGLGLTDPRMVAEMILAQRAAIARDWGEMVGAYVPAELQKLRAESLEDSLQSDDEPLR